MKRAWKLSAIILIVILVVAGLVVWIWGGSKEDPTPQSTPTPTATTTAPPAPTAQERKPGEGDGSKSVCGLKAGDWTIPTEAPETTWTMNGQVLLPSVEGVGPGITDEDGTRRCYAHTPTGALLAATNTVLDAGNHPRQFLNPNLVVESEADRAAREANQDHWSMTLDEGTGVSVLGFDVVESTAADLVVRLALGITTKTGYSMAEVDVPMVWADGDWKIQQDQSWPPASAVQIQPGLQGFVAWGKQ